MENKFKLIDFELIKVLGRGSSSIVKLAKIKQSETFVALKITNEYSFKSEKHSKVMLEISAHCALDHTNIVKYLGSFNVEISRYFYIVMEYCERGSVFDDLKKYGAYSETRTATHLFQLASALEYLHSRKLIHRDIKTENVLLTVSGAVKLTDFGIAADQLHKHNTYCGTLSYIAPEVYKGLYQTSKMDMWSLGMLVYEMLHLSLPKVEDCKSVDFDWSYKGSLSPLTICLIYNLLREEPHERLDAAQVLRHPFIQRFAVHSLSSCVEAVTQWKSNGENDSSLTSADFEFSSIPFGDIPIEKAEVKAASKVDQLCESTFEVFQNTLTSFEK